MITIVGTSEKIAPDNWKPGVCSICPFIVLNVWDGASCSCNHKRITFCNKDNCPAKVQEIWISSKE